MQAFGRAGPISATECRAPDSTKYWVAVKELKLSYRNSKTTLPYYLLYICIMVTSIKFLNSKPDFVCRIYILEALR